MATLNAPRWPVGTELGLFRPGNVSVGERGDARPTAPPVATGVVTAAGVPPTNQVTFDTTESGRLIVTGLNGGISVQVRLGS